MRPTGVAALPVVGLVAGVGLALVMLLAPVRASFGDDPVLRLQGFDRQRSFLATSVDCGTAPSLLTAPEGTRTVYEVARDDACHRAGTHRFWVALACGAIVVAASLTGLVIAVRGI
jgi:hypothetical protein